MQVRERREGSGEGRMETRGERESGGVQSAGGATRAPLAYRASTRVQVTSDMALRNQSEKHHPNQSSKTSQRFREIHHSRSSSTLEVKVLVTKS